MNAWGAWFGGLGAAVIDGGNPVGKSYTVKPDGSLVDNGGANPASGYSLIEASSIEDAHAKAKGCPLLKSGRHDRVRPGDGHVTARRASPRTRGDARAPTGITREETLVRRTALSRLHRLSDGGVVDSLHHLPGPDERLSDAGNYVDPTPRPVPLWGQRANRAHINAVETFAPFAALVLIAHVAGKENGMTAFWAIAFFWLRLIHAIVYLAGLPFIRTLVFVLGFVAVCGLFWEVVK